MGWSRNHVCGMSSALIFAGAERRGSELGSDCFASLAMMGGAVTAFFERSDHTEAVFTD